MHGALRRELTKHKDARGQDHMDAVDEEESTQVEKKRVMLIVVRFLRGLAMLQIDIFSFFQ
jgi:hypothetical protein